MPTYAPSEKGIPDGRHISLSILLVSRRIFCMKELMGLVSERLPQILLIDGLYSRVVVRLAVLQFFIFLIECCCPQPSFGIARRNRLTATADTPTGTCHYLDKVIGCISIFDLVQELSCVAETVGHRYFDIADPFDGDDRLFYPSRPLTMVKSRSRKCLSREYLVNGPEGCLHDAARGPEDRRCTRVLAQRIVVGLVR